MADSDIYSLADAEDGSIPVIEEILGDIDDSNALADGRYTRKTQALSVQRKQAEQHTAFNQQWSQIAIDLAHAAMLAINSATPQKPDIRLAERDSHAYLVAKDAHERGQELLKQLATKAGNVMQLRAIKTAQDVQALHAQAHAQLIQRYAYLRDDRHFKSALRKASEVLLERYNIDISEVPPDARYYALVHEHEKMLNNPKFRDNLIHPAPRVQQPGARRSSNGEAKAKRDAWTRLQRGDKDAGTELIEDILGNG